MKPLAQLLPVLHLITIRPISAAFVTNPLAHKPVSKSPTFFTASEKTEASPATMNAFDEEAYETNRLARDAEAMNSMKQMAEGEFSKLRTPWKWTIRKRIWDLLEAKDIARPPRPVHHRIPNFDGADMAARRLADLPEFQTANCVKVNPDTPQRPVRHLTLEQGKTLLTPQPRLRTGFFSTISMDDESLPADIRVGDCTTSKGVAKYGTPVTLYDKYTVDLVVVGSTAVCPNTGARVGKGEGFAELEWGILSLQGNLDAQKTLVATTVHDEQVVNDIPAGELTKHDVPVDIIVTPTRTIRVPNRAPKPSGVFWDLLSPQKLAQIRVLQQLKKDTEERSGMTLPCGPDEVLPPTASRGGQKRRKTKGPNVKDGTPLNELQVGSLVTGKVKSFARYGAFVDIKAERDGLLHVSKISTDFVRDARDFLKNGQEVDVYIIEVDLEKNRISLSLIPPESGEET